MTLQVRDVTFNNKIMFSRAFSLTEVLVAITLMGAMIIASTSVDITSRKFFEATKGQSHIQDEIKIAMKHIVKNLILGHEVYDFGALDGDFFTIGARLDPLTTPGDSSDDNWIVYQFVSNDPDQDNRPTIRYYPDADAAGAPPASGWSTWQSTSYEIIATEIFVDGTTPNMFVVDATDNNHVEIDITAYDAEQDIKTNLKTTVVLRSKSVR